MEPRFIVGIFIAFFIIAIFYLYWTSGAESFIAKTPFITENDKETLMYAGMPVEFAKIDKMQPLIYSGVYGLKVPNTRTYVDQSLSMDGIIVDRPSGEKKIDDKTDYADYSIFKSISRIENFKPMKNFTTFTRDKLKYEDKREF